MSKIIYTKKYRQNLILYWRQFLPNWDIPKGYHVHHIKPQSLFDGTLDAHHPKNLIALHPDDHLSIHKNRGDVFVDVIVNSPLFSIKGIKRKPFTDEHKRKLRESNLGKKQSKETIEKRVKSNTGKKRSKEQCERISNGKRGGTKSSPSLETREKLRKVMVGKKQKLMTCPHCGKSGGNTMGRWHFDNCKYKKGN